APANGFCAVRAPGARGEAMAERSRGISVSAVASGVLVAGLVLLGGRRALRRGPQSPKKGGRPRRGGGLHRRPPGDRGTEGRKAPDFMIEPPRSTSERAFTAERGRGSAGAPSAADGSEARPPSSSGDAPQGPTGVEPDATTVLIVDDEPSNLASIEK